MLLIKNLKELQPSWFFEFYWYRFIGEPKGDFDEVRSILIEILTYCGHLWPWFEGLFTSDEVEFPHVEIEKLSRKGDSLFVSFRWSYQTTDDDGDVMVHTQDFWDMCIPRKLCEIIFDAAEFYIQEGDLSQETWDNIPECERSDDDEEG